MNRLNKFDKTNRVQSLDLLRGVVMIIMALDHVRDYFHFDAFMYSPEDLTQTNVPVFLTRWITHFCAPVFVFLAGTSSYLYGVKRSKKELSFFLWTRGLWLVFVELFIINLFRTFNLSYTFLNVQVIWAIGISMIILSLFIYINRQVVLVIGLLLVGAHNLFDDLHVAGTGFSAIFWSILHDPNHFLFGDVYFNVRYPVLPWIGIMLLGYYVGSLYTYDYDPIKRRKILRLLGIASIVLFIILRFDNWYGDAAHWLEQKNFSFSVLSFLNVTKYPPSLQYTLVTLGPALVFLSVSEKPLKWLEKRIAIYGRVPMFYYLAHILLIHFLASIAGVLTGYPEMIVINSGVNAVKALKGYGFSLTSTYLLWVTLVILLFPFCQCFDKYKRTYSAKYWWLSYL